MNLSELRKDKIFCMAPMVGVSDAPFRSLVLKYGATWASTEMFYSERIVHDQDYLDQVLPEIDHEFSSSYPSRRLCVQLCGNEPSVLAEAALIVKDSGRCEAIELNLGCPQDRAREGLFG